MKGGYMTGVQGRFEADNRTGINHEGPDANRPVRRLAVTSIVGDRVENSEGESLGHIEDLMINIQTGTVEYAVVEYGAFLGMGGRLFAIPFSELKINTEKRIFVVNREKEYLNVSPGFNKNHWPHTHARQVYSSLDS